jgi:hypothetical protein
MKAYPPPLSSYTTASNKSKSSLTAADHHTLQNDMPINIPGGVHCLQMGRRGVLEISQCCRQSYLATIQRPASWKRKNTVCESTAGGKSSFHEDIFRKSPSIFEDNDLARGE